MHRKSLTGSWKPEIGGMTSDIGHSKKSSVDTEDLDPLFYAAQKYGEVIQDEEFSTNELVVRDGEIMWLQYGPEPEFVHRYLVITETMLKIYEDKDTHETMPEEVLV